jgi:hypothetical protein
MRIDTYEIPEGNYTIPFPEEDIIGVRDFLFFNTPYEKGDKYRYDVNNVKICIEMYSSKSVSVQIVWVHYEELRLSTERNHIEPA